MLLSVAFALVRPSPLNAAPFQHSGLSDRSTAHCNALRNAGPAQKTEPPPNRSFCPLDCMYYGTKSEIAEKSYYSPPPRDIQFVTVGGEGKRMNDMNPAYSNLRLQFHSPEKEALNFNATK